ncbi:uncharacterized protein [Physcomitrium patens]|uniref:uncharacterized protein isoform X1 n=1 Tax=Physcomitrium patens TaxID=3218 RepID=UPI003CCD3066
MKPSKLVCFATFQRICQHWHIALLGDVHVWPPPSCTHRVIVKQRMQVHGLYTNSWYGSISRCSKFERNLADGTDHVVYQHIVYTMRGDLLPRENCPQAFSSIPRSAFCLQCEDSEFLLLSSCGITQASVHFDSATRRVADAVKGLGSSALSQCTAICGQVLHI